MLIMMETVPKAHCSLARESERGVGYSNILRACTLSPMSSRLDKGNTHRGSCTAHRCGACTSSGQLACSSQSLSLTDFVTTHQFSHAHPLYSTTLPNRGMYAMSRPKSGLKVVLRGLEGKSSIGT